MSENMNEDRIRRWKCLFCGSNQKRKIDAISDKTTPNKLIGYSLMCCNCGHIDNFALTQTGIALFTCGVNHDVTRLDISCPLSEDDLAFCPNKKCTYRAKEWKEKETSSVATAANNMVIDRKYQ